MKKLEGLVTHNTGSHYRVLCDDGKERLCLIKGNLRLRGIRSTNPVAVGDRVQVEVMSADGDNPDYIREILPRRNYIIRRASNLSKESHILGANLDRTLLVCTVVQPQTSTTFIDRYLATAEAYRVPAALVWNKTDLYGPKELEELEFLCAMYRYIGYPCYCVSAETGEGVEALSADLAGQTTLLAGHSGVGKSSLINRLVPGINLRTAEISDAHRTGMHTTTFSQMIALPGSAGGYLIDTPGVKGFGTIDMAPEEVRHYFPEIFKESAHCRFNNCSHTHEPGCAVLAALEEGRIPQSRYTSYLGIMEDKDETKYRQDH